MAVILEPSFALGELSDALSGRIDMEWYGKGLATCRNFTILPSGGATLRPGTEYCGQVPDMTRPSRLIPFAFNAEETFCMLFNGGNVYLLQDGGFVVDDEGNIYSFEFEVEDDELSELRYAQTGDVVWMVHRNYPPRQIKRYGNTNWVVETPTFMPKLDAPTNLTATTTATVSSGSVEYSYCVTAYNDDGDESEKSDTVTIDSKDLGLDNTQITLTWDAVDGADEYKIYKDTAGTFGLVGYATECTWTDKNYEADLSTTPLNFENPFEEEGDYPSTVGFIQQRLVMAGTENNPQKVWMSRSGDFENFGRSNPTQDDDAIYISLYSRSVNWIRGLVSARTLLVLTGGTEFSLAGQSTDSVITPSTCKSIQQSAYGSAAIDPVMVGNSVLLLERGGGRVRDLSYDYSVDGYQGNDLSIRSQHLLHGHSIIAWAYQTQPDGLLWCVRDDGVLLTMTYNREHQIYAWTQHETEGTVEDVCCVPGDTRDEVYFVVLRTVNGEEVRYVERLAEPFRDENAETAANAWYVDCGLRYEGDAVDELSGLDHLEGCEVAVLADGGPLYGLTVTDGTLTLPREYSTILVGLPYTGLLKTLRVNASDESGPSQGRKQKIGYLALRFDKSVGGEVGWERYGTDGTVLEEKWTDIKHRTVQQGCYASPPFSGDRTLVPPVGWDNRGQVMIRQSDPLPLTLLCCVLNVRLGEK